MSASLPNRARQLWQAPQAHAQAMSLLVELARLQDSEVLQAPCKQLQQIGIGMASPRDLPAH